MGDIADYYMDLSFEEDARQEHRQHLIRREEKRLECEFVDGTLEWHSMNGLINLKAMTTSHINNTIIHVQKKVNSPQSIINKWVELFNRELKKRNV